MLTDVARRSQKSAVNGGRQAQGCHLGRFLGAAVFEGGQPLEILPRGDESSHGGRLCRLLGEAVRSLVNRSSGG